MTTPDTTATERAAYIRGLRQLADFLEQDPRIEVTANTCTGTHLLGNDATVANFVNQARRAGIPDIDESTRGYVVAERHFDGSVSWRVQALAKDIDPAAVRIALAATQVVAA